MTERGFFMHFKGLSAILLAALFWGLSFISIKVAVETVPPMTLALLRFIVAALLLYPWLRLSEPNCSLKSKHRSKIALTGFIGVTLYFFFQNTGILYTSASEASLIIAGIPVLTLLADVIFCKSPLSLRQCLGIALSMPGVYFLLQSGESSAGGWLGNLYMFGAALSWVSYCLLTRPLGKYYSQLAIVTYQALFGAVALLQLSLLEAAAWQPLDLNALLHIAYLGIFCSALGYYLYVYAMEQLGVSTVSLFVNFIPVVSVAGGFFLLGEKIAPLQLLGGLIIICAVIIVSCGNSGNKGAIDKSDLA